ncbi:MAG: ATP-binding protein, partial [Pyrobaculum sp.]
LKTGTSIALIGPHGTGKSVLARYIAAKLAAERYIAVDLSVDVHTFDNILEMLQEVDNAFGLYDPLGPAFYDSPKVLRGEVMLSLRERCKYIATRLTYLQGRGVPTLLVLPTDMYRHLPCGLKAVEVIDTSEQLQKLDVPSILRDVFASHASALGCERVDADPYIKYMLSRHKDLSGVFPLAVYGAKAYSRRKCVYDNVERLYGEAVRELSDIYRDLYKVLFNHEARDIQTAFCLSLQGVYLPPAVAVLLPEARRIMRKLSLMKTPIFEWIKEDVLEELREIYEREITTEIKWATARKESIVRETLQGLPCPHPYTEVATQLRAIYRGLFTIRPQTLYEFARAIAKIAYGEDICREEVGKYLCNDEVVPPVVLDALTQGGRITAGMYTEVAIQAKNPVELLTQLAMVDARRVVSAIDNFIEVALSIVTHDPRALSRLYLLYGDYFKVSAEAGNRLALRRLALVHYFGEVPPQAVDVLKTVVKRALEQGDCKTSGLANISLATIAPMEAVRLPECAGDLPLIRNEK